jgi:hypothetical protein
MNKVYPDTSAGAIECLRDESALVLTGKMDCCPDPYVVGVWEVRSKGIDEDQNWRVIVYLKGYKDPWGQVRTENDFEAEDIDMPVI